MGWVFGRYRRGFDLYGVVLVASLGVGVIFVAYRAISRDGQVHTWFDADGRAAASKYLRYNYPKFATDWGI